MENKIEELNEIIRKLKEENIYLQKKLKSNEPVELDEDDYDSPLEDREGKGNFIFKNQNNCEEDDTFFIDILLMLYDEIISYVELARNYDEKNDVESIEYMLFKIFDCYKNRKKLLRYYICKKRIDHIDEVMEKTVKSTISAIDKVEYFYNKIYYEIFIEFFGNYSFSA